MARLLLSVLVLGLCAALSVHAYSGDLNQDPKSHLDPLSLMSEDALSSSSSDPVAERIRSQFENLHQRIKQITQARFRSTNEMASGDAGDLDPLSMEAPDSTGDDDNENVRAPPPSNRLMVDNVIDATQDVFNNLNVADESQLQPHSI